MKTLPLALLFLLPSLASAQTVDILWQGVNYAPPFYAGGAPWSQEGSLMFFAVPQGLGNPANLDYKWVKDGTVLGSVSGRGQSALYSNDPIFGKPQEIKVQIVDSDDNVITEKTIIVAPVPPEVLVYENNPLFGLLFNRAVGESFQLTDKEASFAAFPLYFSTRARNDAGLTYSWRSRGKDDSAASSVTYRAPEGAAGSAAVSVKVSKPSTVRQMVDKGFVINFGNEN